MQQQYSRMIAGSPLEQLALAACFHMHSDDIWITNTPRIDSLLGTLDFSIDPSAKELLSSLASKRVVLYAPTWRLENDAEFFPFPDLDLSALDGWLSDNNCKLLIRSHHLEEKDRFLDRNLNHIVNVSHLDDVQDILSITDVLITDYSSIYFDFLVLDRPIVFVPYDLPKYASNPGLMFDFDSMAPGPKIATQADLKACLSDFLASAPDHYAKARASVRARVHQDLDGYACQRIVERIRALCRSTDRPR